MIYLFLASTLEKYLYQLVFLKHEIRSSLFFESLTATNKVAQGFARTKGKSMREVGFALALRLGFTPFEFSDSFTFCAQRGDIKLGISQNSTPIDDQGLGIWLSGPTRNDIEPLGKHFVNELHLRRSE
jgi:hypothetical protein